MNVEHHGPTYARMERIASFLRARSGLWVASEDVIEAMDGEMNASAVRYFLKSLARRRRAERAVSGRVTLWKSH